MGCGNIDWSATGDMLQGIGAILGAFVVLGAALVGQSTFKNWRQQTLSQRRIEQAERILTATYKVRRALSRVRSPMMMSHELQAAEQRLRERGLWQTITTKDDEERWRKTEAYYGRLQSIVEEQKELEECQPMARALFGEELEKALEALNHQFWTVKVYVDANHNDRIGSDNDFRRKIDCTLYSGYPSDEQNEIDQIIQQKVSAIENVCVPVLRLEEQKSFRLISI